MHAINVAMLFLILTLETTMVVCVMECFGPNILFFFYLFFF